MWYEIFDNWSNRYLLERFTYQQARGFLDKNQPPDSGRHPLRYTILPAR